MSQIIRPTTPRPRAGHHPERLRIGDRDHVRLLDRVEARDRRAVEAHPVVERRLDLGRGDREALQVPLEVGEPEEDVLDLLLSISFRTACAPPDRTSPDACSRSSPFVFPPLRTKKAPEAGRSASEATSPRKTSQSTRRRVVGRPGSRPWWRSPDRRERDASRAPRRADDRGPDPNDVADPAERRSAAPFAADSKTFVIESTVARTRESPRWRSARSSEPARRATARAAHPRRRGARGERAGQGEREQPAIRSASKSSASAPSARPHRGEPAYERLCDHDRERDHPGGETPNQTIGRARRSRARRPRRGTAPPRAGRPLIRDAEAEGDSNDQEQDRVPPTRPPPSGRCPPSRRAPRRPRGARSGSSSRA